MGLGLVCLIHAGWEREKQNHFHQNVLVQSLVSCIKDSNSAVGVQVLVFRTDIFPLG